MRFLNLNILTDSQLLAMQLHTWNRAENATIERCAQHLEEVKPKVNSEPAKRILELAAHSLRKLENVNA